MPMSVAANNDDDDVEEREAEVNRTLFLRGIPDQTTEDELYELFLQAGPLEKVAIPQNKNMAFITYKHSVSAPYAKELFCDTKLHGKLLSVDFRTGSAHTSNQSRRERYNSQDDRRRSSGSYQQASAYQTSRQAYTPSSQQNGRFSSPYQVPAYNQNLMQSPFVAANQRSNQGIQGYRSTVENREYVPQYVSFDSPPANFIGAVPVNQLGHQVSLEERRQRLLHQQQYNSQVDMQRNMSRYSSQRR